MPTTFTTTSSDSLNVVLDGLWRLSGSATAAGSAWRTWRDYSTQFQGLDATSNSDAEGFHWVACDDTIEWEQIEPPTVSFIIHKERDEPEVAVNEEAYAEFMGF